MSEAGYSEDNVKIYVYESECEADMLGNAGLGLGKILSDILRLGHDLSRRRPYD